MTVDFHTHIFPEKIAHRTIAQLAEQSGYHPYADGTIDGLLGQMEQGGVDLSVALPVVTKPEQFTSITRFALAVNERFQEGAHRILSFGGVHPDSAHVKEELHELKRLGFRGIKLHPDYQKVNFNDIRYKRIVDMASELDLIISVHAGVDVGLPEFPHCPPEYSLEVIQELAPPKLVLAHLGGWQQWNQVEELLVGQNVFLDTAVAFGICEEEQLTRIIHNHGANRILFATDSPWSGQKESVAALHALALTEEEIACIESKNALALLGLDDVQTK